MCFGCSLEQSHWDSYFDYQQNMFWLRNEKKIWGRLDKNLKSVKYQNIWALAQENLTLLHVNNKGDDQPAHAGTLNSIFVFPSLERKTAKAAKF